jgi:hypothetical protein
VRRAASSGSQYTRSAVRAGPRRAHSAARRVVERGPGSREPVKTRPARENHPLIDDCGTNRPPQTGSNCADTPCPARPRTPYAHYRSRKRQRLRPPGAFGRAVRDGWRVGGGRVLTAPRRAGTHRTAFAASGAGRAQPLTRRSDERDAPPRHGSRATPPQRGREELAAPGARRAQPLTLSGAPAQFNVVS